MTEVKDADIASSAWHMDLIVARRAQKGSAFGICSNIRTKQGFTSQSTGRSRWSDSVGRSPCIRNMPVSICRASLLCWGMLKRRDGLQKPLWIQSEDRQVYLKVRTEAEVTARKITPSKFRLTSASHAFGCASDLTRLKKGRIDVSASKLL